MANRQNGLEGEELTDNKSLAKVQSVEEMIPTPLANNQISKGRAAKIGEEQYRIIEAYLMMDSTIEEACMAAGISMPSYYEHKQKNPEFSRRMAIAREYPKIAARAAVMKRIRLGDAKTAMEYLKLRDKRYKQEAVEEEVGQNTAPVVQFISVASSEGADQSKNDSQTPIKQSSASEGFSNSGENEIEMTPWENSEQVLKNIDSLSFSSD